MQNKKSKYKVPEFDVLLETEFLHPMIKGKDITIEFELDNEEVVMYTNFTKLKNIIDNIFKIRDEKSDYSQTL